MKNLHDILYDVLVKSPINHEHVIDILTFFVINTLLLSSVYILVKVYTFTTKKCTEDEKYDLKSSVYILVKVYTLDEKYDLKRVVADIAANTVTILLLSFVTVIFFLETGWYVNTFVWFGTNIILGLIGDILVSMTFSKRTSIANYVYSKVTGIVLGIVDRFSNKK